MLKKSSTPPPAERLPASHSLVPPPNHSAEAKVTKRNWIIAAVIAGGVCTALIVLGVISYVTFSSSGDSGLRKSFDLHAGTHSATLETRLKTLETTLSLASTGIESLPSPLNRTEVFEILATAAGRSLLLFPCPKPLTPRL